MASSTTNDQEIARNPHPPKGLGRDGPISLLLLLADVSTSTRRRASIWSPSRSQHTSSYLWQGVLDFTMKFDGYDYVGPGLLLLQAGAFYFLEGSP